MRSHETTLIADHIRPSEDARHLTPGSLLAGRYRLAGPVGSGGMGVVYRADDLKVGQTVALKFIPPAVAGDPDRVARLVDEVRVGRQVAHPNVCRLYDIVESDGLHFIAMELVDGEDLASLLRRVGLLPRAKALDLARDICSGLAAAHDLGIVHRDMKPANIMIDGRGHARITDFGLATSTSDSRRHRGITGTPGYMSPEQARGQLVTTASDIFSLGIVLYEMFTGRQAYEAESSSELIALTASGTPPLPPSTVAPDIDPDVERIIVQCLASDPASRPSSARDVLSALHAKDVLDAAIEAGETPLPEVVAAAGARGNLEPRVAWTLVALAFLCTAAGVALWQASYRGQLLRQLRSPESLRERAAELAATLAPAADKQGSEFSGHVSNAALIEKLSTLNKSDQWQPLLDRPEEAMHFWYRRGVEDTPSYFRHVSFADPTHIDPGSVSVLLDGSGKLRKFRQVPAEKGSPATMSWAPFFAAAGLDPGRLDPATPPHISLPPVPSDRIEAWHSGDGRDLIVIGGTRGGSPVFFDVLSPLDRGTPVERTAASEASGYGFTIVLVLITVGAFILARRNANRGRIDNRGAWLIAMFIFATFTISWVLSASTAKLLEGIAYGVLTGVLAWLIYVAVEPYVRRRWPATLVGWSRLLHGRARDPHVGRDILIGLTAAAVSRIVVSVVAVVLERAGVPDSDPTGLRIRATTRAVVSEVFHDFYLAVLMTLCFLFVLYAVTLIVRRRAIAVVVVCAILVLLFVVDGGVVVIGLMAMLIVIDRFGLLAGTAMTYGSFLQAEIITFELDRWYSGPSMLAAVMLAALTLYAARQAAARHRVA